MKTAGDENRATQVLGKPGLAWLVASVRRRLERGGGTEGRLAFPGEISSMERDALGRILGRRIPSDARSFALGELETVLVQAGLSSLRSAVELLVGPIRNRREERRDALASWKEIFTSARTSLQENDALLFWLEKLERTGILRRLARGDMALARSLLASATTISSSLPAQGITLAELAASSTGDSHALDYGSALGALVMRAAAEVSGCSHGWQDSEARRSLWESVGVFCDDLSASVLTLNLRAGSGSLSGSTLSSHAAQGEPCRLTLRELVRHPPDFNGLYQDQTIFVCENPAVLSYMADRFGPRTAPLLCLEGKPRTPAARVLRQLSASGARLNYHGDFDWEGIRIANFIMKNFGATPWRMSAADYAAVGADGPKLTGSLVSALWDTDLAHTMSAIGRAVHEESVLETLAGDVKS